MRLSRHLPAFLALIPLVGGPAAHAELAVNFVMPGVAESLASSIKGASLTESARADERTEAQEIFAAARSDYARILGALYAEGYYSGVIRISVDGREVADIQPLNAPSAIRNVTINVQPGPQFTFSRADIGPLAWNAEPDTAYKPGEVARSGAIRRAAENAVEGWRKIGHAKADVSGQQLTAIHPKAQMEASVTVASGPLVYFGNLSFRGKTQLREARMHKIAGLPEGEKYSPEELEKAADRLRRTGVFRSVSLTEAETLSPGNRLDITASVADLPQRRLGFGAEITTSEGAMLSAFWLHRNLLGGAERLRVEAEVARIGASEGGPDFRLGLELERPATFTPDTIARLAFELEREEDHSSTVDNFTAGFGLSHIYSKTLTLRADLKYGYTRTEDALGKRIYRTVSLPLGATWDRRDTAINPQKGFWIDGELMPFYGLSDTGSGLRAKFEARGYRPVGERLVVAARLQAGLISGADLLETPSDYLFWSGGGGTVRGQEYRSLGVPIGNNVESGGTKFAAASLELRGKVTEKIGVVGFVDYGTVSDKLWSAAPLDDWHGGAGLGLRYLTPVGPMRLDVAAPVGGRKGSGVQFYLGIGQAF